VTTFNLDGRVSSDRERHRSPVPFRWPMVKGFKIAAADHGCYLIRRVSDGSVLPETVPRAGRPTALRSMRPAPIPTDRSVRHRVSGCAVEEIKTSMSK